ncbi:MAG: hypothetical protein ABJA76_11470 [Mucilaginibacter sp.]
MENPNIEKETRMYLFDLTNTALENGFKADDNWELVLGTEAQKTKIQKDYYPAVAAKIFAEIALPVYYTIKSRLHQPLNAIEQSLDVKTVLKDNLNYVIAYNPKRQRT